MLAIQPDFQRRFAADRREGFQKFFQRIVIGEILEQRLYRNARVLEDRRTAYDFGLLNNW
jgi:hypothetical protein